MNLERQGKEKRGERMSSHISIEEDVIRVCTGGASEVTPVAPRTAAVTATGEGSCGVASSGSGLSVDVVGTANVSSTEVRPLEKRLVCCADLA